jgi:hypothetical protein
LLGNKHVKHEVWDTILGFLQTYRTRTSLSDSSFFFFGRHFLNKRLSLLQFHFDT